MKDISTEDLVRSFAIAIERRVRAEDILKLETSAKNAAAVKARQREERNALTALNRHFKECVSLTKRAASPEANYVFHPSLKHSLPTRVVRALQDRLIEEPQHKTIAQLLKIPGIGVKGVAAIAYRCYPQSPETWAELE